MQHNILETLQIIVKIQQQTSITSTKTAIPPKPPDPYINSIDEQTKRPKEEVFVELPEREGSDDGDADVQVELDGLQAQFEKQLYAHELLDKRHELDEVPLTVNYIFGKQLYANINDTRAVYEAAKTDSDEFEVQKSCVVKMFNERHEDVIEYPVGVKVLTSGFLCLSSRGIGWTSWKKRWFVLTQTSLVFFLTDPNEVLPNSTEVNCTLSGIDLNSSGSVIVKEDKKLITVQFSDGQEERTFTLKAETADDLLEWKVVLEEALANAPSDPLPGDHDQENAADVADQSMDKQQEKSMVLGRPVLYALEETDGTPSFLGKALRFVEEQGIKVKGILRQAADVEHVEGRIKEYEQGHMVESERPKSLRLEDVTSMCPWDPGINPQLKFISDKSRILSLHFLAKMQVYNLEPGSDTRITKLLLVHGLFFGYKLETDDVAMNRDVYSRPWEPGITYLGTSMLLVEGSVMALRIRPEGNVMTRIMIMASKLKDHTNDS